VTVLRPSEIPEQLRLAGLRPTRQRLALARILFNGMDRHICAETLFDEAVKAKLSVSLATVYNTLKQFRQAGLLREVAIEGDRNYYDTNTSNHFHFFDEEMRELHDLDADQLKLVGLPTPPAGREIDRIDVIVRLKPVSKSSS
jgi:Fur family transcriptional regulator, iron response regulator